MSDFWTKDRHDSVERDLETVPPYKLARTILQEF
jgi:hypothetical protein